MDIRSQSLGEEITNSVLHGIGAIFSIVALILLILHSISLHSIAYIISYTIFGSSLILLYCLSTLHHSISGKRAKHVFLVLDYAAIYILIAATFTPFLAAILGLKNTLNIVLLIVIWILAITGITLSSVFSKRIKTIAPAFYIPMGWLAVFILKPLQQSAGTQAVTLLIAGGVAYSLGTYFYLNDHKKYHHAIWHIFVLIGSALHVISLLGIR